MEKKLFYKKKRNDNNYDHYQIRVDKHIFSIIVKAVFFFDWNCIYLERGIKNEHGFFVIYFESIHIDMMKNEFDIITNIWM